MALIILKIILCSSLFIAGYYLFLEKEKMYRFNRFFLIFSLIFSYVAPFISITTELPKQTAKPQLIFEETTQDVLILPAKILPVKQENFDWMNLIWIIYGIITLFLLSKAVISILKIKNINGKKLIYQNHNIIATKENFSPFSFWNTIYLGEKHLVNNEIDTRIFLHEKSHLDQKHSLDLLLIEVLKIFTWFNPVIFLYKKAIVTNHELLADEAVLKNNFDIRDYQNLILQEIILTQKYNLTHSFNFNNTKKRFIMMTTKKSKFIVLKKLISIPAFIVAFVIFVQKTYANDTNLPINNSQDNETSLKNPEKVLSADPYEEFKNILNKYSDLLNDKKYAEFTSKVSKEDKQKLETLYFQLTDEQKNEQRIVFYKTTKPKNRIPTAAELNSFMDKSKYAVWIDDRKIENSILKNYKASDFANVSISGVYKNARTLKNPQPFQVTLSTPDAYEKYLNERSEVAMGFKVKWEAHKSPNNTSTAGSVKASINDEEKPETKFISDVAIPQAATSDNITAPEYPGGSNQLRKNVSNLFDGSKVESPGSQTYKCEINYVIDETGKLADVEAKGNNEVFNTLSKSAFLAANKDIAWKPAIKDGKAVRYRMKMPLTMSFQNFR